MAITGTNGDETLYGTSLDDVIYGLNGNDILNGSSGYDELYGGAGYDQLNGGMGNDTLDGGADNDMLDGGTGNNTYLFGKGDGQDTLVTVNESTFGKLNTLQFKSGVAVSEVTASRSGTNLILSIAGTDSLTVQHFFLYDDPSSSSNPLQQIKFADGTVWNTTVMAAKAMIGTAADNVIAGTVNDDTVTGNAGNDTLSGNGGNDTLNGGAGYDQLNGGVGNDTLDGGADNDQLNGGTGNNTYLFGKGDGQDTLAGFSDGTLGKLNTLQFKSGVAVFDVMASRSGANLILSIAGTDSVTVEYFFSGDDPANSYNPLQQIKFADGTVWNTNAIAAKAMIGTAADNVIAGTVNDDTVTGNAGNDTLSGNGGNDTLNGGAGYDQLNGGVGNDTLDGGADNDQLNGGTGNNTYLFGKGDGQDTLAGFSDSTFGKLNTLQFKSDVAVFDVTASRSGANLLLSIAGTDSLTVEYFFYLDNPANSYNPLQEIIFADGTVWNTNAIAAKALIGTAADNVIAGTVNDDTVTGNGGNDTLSGNGGNDTLFGGAGYDQLNGGVGNDTLDGGADNDQLNGGTGNNTYLFGKGDGQDTLAGFSDGTFGKLNTLQFKSDVAVSDVTASRSGYNLIMNVAGTDSLTVEYFFYSDNPANSYNPLQQIKFADGTVWDTNAIVAKAFIGGAGNDIINGTINSDTITGGAGSDQLSGGLGNDTLDGGADNDTLNGGTGNNTYLFGKGDGQDELAPVNDGTFGKLNTLQFKSDVAVSEVTASRSGYNLILNVAGTDSLTVDYFFYNDDPANAYNTVQQVKFADGAVWNTNTIVAKAFTGGAGNDIIDGTINNDIITGGAGYDRLSGGIGNDTLDGGADNDSLNGGTGNNTYLFGRGDGHDTLFSSYDSKLGKLNTLQFRAGIAVSEVAATRSDTSLVLTISDTDSVTVSLFFYSDNPANSYNPLQQIKFADGTVWDINAIVPRTLTGGTFTGTSGDDVLVGTLKDDHFFGGLGDDTYFVNHVGDVVTESSALATEIDTVSSSVSFVLGANLENLTLTGAPAIDGSGNTLANVLTGNKAANTLDGKAGADIMIGGSGNDTYIVDNAGDVVVETSVLSSEIDTVKSSISYTLGANLENLTLSGAAAINGTGNKLNNVLTGNSADNTLSGGLGNDTLNGDAGNDLLKGGEGADLLIGGTGKDTCNLTETTAATDTLRIAAGDSLVTGFDAATGFKLGTGIISTLGVDRLDLDSTNIAANTVVDGSNSGIIHSHSIANGIISFDDADTYNAALSINLNKLASVFSYLQDNITAGDTVAFNALGNTYVFQDGGLSDTLVQLTGITASSLSNNGLVADGMWIV